MFGLRRSINDVGPKKTAGHCENKSNGYCDGAVFVKVLGTAPLGIGKHHGGERRSGRGQDGEIGAEDEHGDKR